MKIFYSLLILVASFKLSFGQVPSPALIGYFQNWNSPNAGYVPLDQIDSRYNVIAVAFAAPRSGTDYDMVFTPYQVTPSQFATQIQALKNQGKKVLLSIGGGGVVVKLDNATEKNTFISSINSIINTYGFDGIDIDFEGTSVRVSSGTTIANPTDASIVNLIDAIKSIMGSYSANYDEKMILTMAPETAYVQGGQSSYGGPNGRGSYLPIIHALRDSIDILQVQLYNSGDMFGIGGGIYTQGTADFLVAMTEAVIVGFNTNGGFFQGLPANKIALGLPACSSAAGGGYTSPTVVKSAIDYLLGVGSKPGTYTLQTTYPDLLGMMTWSINWDAISTCSASYSYAQNFQDIFLNTQTSVEEHFLADLKVFPNPTKGIVKLVSYDNSENNKLEVITLTGEILLTQSINLSNEVEIDLSPFQSGMYLLRISNAKQSKNIRVSKF